MFFDDRDRLSFRLSDQDRVGLDLILLHLQAHGFTPTVSDCVHFAIKFAYYNLFPTYSHLYSDADLDLV